MDIAKVGFSVDTRELDKGTASLNKLKAAASGVTGSAAAVNKAAVDIAAAKRLEAKATLDAVNASKQATKEDKARARETLAVARAEESRARAVMASSKATDSLARASRGLGSAQMSTFNTAAGQRRVQGSVATTASGVRIGSTGDAAIARDQMPNRFNTANIAAQFQDIGVTAAMGMNPMLIAMQQGTQISAILNSMENPLKGMAQAFRSIINPVSLLAIGLTALAVAGIQMVDWISVAQGALNGLAYIIENFGGEILIAAAGLTVAMIPAMITAITTMATMGTTALITGAKMAAMWVMANPIPILAAVAAFMAVWAVNTFEPVRNLVNNIIGAFVGAYNSIKAVWLQLPAALGDIIFRAVDNVLGGVEKMVNGTISLMNKIPGVALESASISLGNNPFGGAAAGVGSVVTNEMNKALNNVDYVGVIGQGVTDATKGLASSLRSSATGIGVEDSLGGKGKKSQAELYQELIDKTNQRVASLKLERDMIGLTETQQFALRKESELLNEAKEKGINLTDAQRGQLKDMAYAMAGLTEETNKQKKAYDFLRDAGKGFLDTLRSSLREGQSLFESFTSAVTGLLNKLADRMFEFAADSLLDGIAGAVGGGGGGGGNFLGTALSVAGSFLGFAKGGGFNNGVQMFANGGAFTNGVFSSPQLFQFANGGKFGVMGEAGPEAVMPLHRGSDGSLGVKMVGGGAGGDTYEINIDARGAEAGVEQKIKNVMNEVLTLRKEVPNIALSSVSNANRRNPGFLNG